MLRDFFTYKGAYNRKIKKVNKAIQEISHLNDKQLRAASDDLFNNDIPIHERMIQAIAIICEVAHRTVNQSPYDVQIMGSMAMHDGYIIDMKTGEGKTLSAIITSYLHIIQDHDVHIVTVNDYLVERDASFASKIFNFLGIEVGCLINDMAPELKHEALNCHIVYSTGVLLSLEYLRNYLVYEKNEQTRNTFDVCIIDEADFVLIDEARIPIAISSPNQTDPRVYGVIDRVIQYLKSEDISIDLENNHIELTESGIETAERLLKGYKLLDDPLYSSESTYILHMVNKGLIARHLLHREKQYIIKKNSIILIDEMTGRPQPDKRLPNGLHQALEAKEKLNIQQENSTIAQITYQSYFDMYNHISGMTGTAMSNKANFKAIYNKKVIEIPTNKKTIRVDHNDEVYMNEQAKLNAIVKQVKACNEKGQPVLIGTNYIDYSDILSQELAKHKIKFHVLNAKNHAEESYIIANAGALNAVTIVANMAGRGTDIKLGGADASQSDYEKVINTGGLYVIGAERYSSRRVDDQLRGRSGRQGDPGESKFFVSLEDDFIKAFVSKNIANIMSNSNDDENEPIVSKLLSKAILTAQNRLEAMNSSSRKNLIDYDIIMNKQRALFYALRDKILHANDLYQSIEYFLELYINKLIENIEEYGITESSKDISEFLECNVNDYIDKNDQYIEYIKSVIRQKLELLKADNNAFNAVRQVMLRGIDLPWHECISMSESLKQSNTLKAYGSNDPINIFRQETYKIFMDTMHQCANNIIVIIFRITINVSQDETMYQN